MDRGPTATVLQFLAQEVRRSALGQDIGSCETFLSLPGFACSGRQVHCTGNQQLEVGQLQLLQKLGCGLAPSDLDLIWVEPGGHAPHVLLQVLMVLCRAA